MRWLKYAWIPGAALVALGTYLAFAQPLSQNQVSGNECWNSGQGPGGPTAGFLCTNIVRNGAATQVVSGSGAASTVATTQNGTLLWHGTAPTTWAVQLPNPAFDGEIVRLTTDTTLTTMVTLSVVTSPQNQTLHAAFSSQTITADTSVAWQFNLSLLQWTKIQ
jgi:hypothetical protein